MSSVNKTTNKLTKKLVLTKREVEDFENFFNQYKNSLFSNENNKYFFNSKYNEKQEISFEFSEIEIDENKNINDYENLCEMIKHVVSKTFEELKKYKIDVSDFEYVSNREPSFEDYIINNLIYKTIDDIFDLISYVFILILKVHKLKNGNKRFAYKLLVTMLLFCGFYFKWTNYDNNIYKKHQERDIYSFICKLQKNNLQSLMVQKDSNDINSEEYEFLEYTIIDMKQKGYFDCLDNKQRDEKIKEEIKTWIKSNVVLRY